MRSILFFCFLVVLQISYSNRALAADTKLSYRVGERLSQLASPVSAGYKEIGWDALIPKGWDPMREMKALNLGKLKDSDPRAMEALQKMRELWDAAPVDASLRGERVRIAGFILPLEHKGSRVTEFLLLPYFGACIHVPPPPANQIIHVTVKKPLRDVMSMDAVWVSGTLDVARSASPWGASGYKIKGDLVVPYTDKKVSGNR